MMIGFCSEFALLGCFFEASVSALGKVGSDHAR